MINVVTEYDKVNYYHVIMSEKEAHSLARELHDATYLDDDGSSMIYQLYNALVPTEDVE